MISYLSAPNIIPRKFVTVERYSSQAKLVFPSNLTIAQIFVEFPQSLSPIDQDYQQKASSLILIVQKHKGGKDFFNELVKYLFEWTAAYPDVFKKTSRTWNRASLLAELAKEFDYLDLVSEQQDVTLEDGRIVTIPVIDFAPQVRDFLDSPFVQSHIADGIDRDTFRVIKMPDEHEYDQDAIVGEKHTGFLYQRGIDVHCPSAPNVDPTLVRPLVIILHIDKSHADLFGNLSVIPIQYSLGIVDIDGQYNIKAWRVLAYIPNLSVGKGSDGAKKAQTSEANRRDFHKCLKVAMSSLLKYYKEGGIWWIDPQGRDVLLKPIIQMIIGDSVGQHELIGHYRALKFGCLKAVDSGPNERNHKDFLKYHFERTQKQAAKFSTQIAQGEYERMLLEKVRITIQSFLPEPLAALTEPSTKYKYSKTTFERQFFPEEWDDDDNDMYNVPMSDATPIAPSEATGCYMLNLSIGSDRRVTVSHKWKYGKKNHEGKFLPNVMMGKVISDCHLKYCSQYEVDFHSSLVYQCFTAIKANGIIFRSDPDWLGSGHEWNDWIVARFPHTPPPTHRKVSSRQRAGTRGGEKCIARIMGFFRHANGGLPTYNYVERMNFSWSQVEQSGRDTTTYMVLHCSALKFQYRELVRNFVYKFEMTPLTDMYVLPVDCIVGPLAVFPDLVSATEASNRRFMAVLPSHKHGGYWLNKINSPDTNFADDADDVIMKLT